jgi:hypothetical protein
MILKEAHPRNLKREITRRLMFIKNTTLLKSAFKFEIKIEKIVVINLKY